VNQGKLTIPPARAARGSACFILGIALAGALAAIPAGAQIRGADEEIVVTGTPSLESQVRTFVDKLARMPGGERAGRFEQDFCPVVIGASEAGAEAIAARLRAVARAVGLDVGGAGCQANALVMLTDDKRPFIEALAKRRPEYLGALTAGQIRRLARSPGPAAAWQLVGKVNALGAPIVEDPEMGVPVNRTIDPGSRIAAAARPVFEAAALVLEWRALDGLDATQIADYAAMRLLAQTDPDRFAGTGAPTILTALDAPIGAEVPLSLTEWDFAYLKGLYSSPDALLGGAQRATIAREVIREVGAAER
jgi:hypothetical protein